MSEDMNLALLRVVDHDRISGIRATVVPSPPHATAYPGNHLFINCSYLRLKFARIRSLSNNKRLGTAQKRYNNDDSQSC